jgi:hypothetical protein
MRAHWRRPILIALALLLIGAVVLLSLMMRISPHVRDRAVAALTDRFQSDVELASLDIAVFPRPGITGTGLTLRHKGRTDVPPLIQIASFSASAGVFGLVRSPLRLNSVTLQGLHITIPPGGVHQATADTRQASGDRRQSSDWSTIVIDEIVSRDARLVIVPRDPGKLPRVFDIHDLVMHGLGDGGGATFDAVLTNPTPRGRITSHGTFGPWHAEEPSRTPVRGEYSFDEANLNTIKGIAGTLSSKGTYSGMLERIAVAGETTTPDFSIDRAEQPVPLKTRFQAVVDGTNGDTWLERVEARVVETLIVARGAVVRTEDVKGRQIALDVTIDDGRIEDVLKLAMKEATPVMTGRMRLSTKFLLPAGDRAIIDKLELAGNFSLDQARFSNVNIQQRINELSQRGKGAPAGNGSNVVSKLSGTFMMRGGTLTFADLSFAVPNAVVQLAGTFDVKRELLDFSGDLLLDATLAETTSGWKSMVARVAQPLFRRKGGGSKLPIRISGSVNKPEFGLDLKRALRPN